MASNNNPLEIISFENVIISSRQSKQLAAKCVCMMTDVTQTSSIKGSL